MYTRVTSYTRPLSTPGITFNGTLMCEGAILFSNSSDAPLMCKVAFWQIGYDAGATKFLQNLDDNLGELDIVDTQTMDTVVDNFDNLELLLANAVIG